MNYGNSYAHSIHAYECDPMPEKTGHSLNNKLDYAKENLEKITDGVARLGVSVKTQEQRDKALELLKLCKNTKSDIENINRFVYNHTTTVNHL